MRILGPIFAMWIVVLFSTATPTPVAGEGADGSVVSNSGIQLEGRHGITIHAGVLSQVTAERDVSSGGISSDTRVNGFLGSLSYSYWAGHDWAVDVAAGLIHAETSTSVGAAGVTSKSAGVVPILFGTSFYPSQLAMGSSVRPYGSLAVGPYLGFATNSQVGTTLNEESVLKSVLGFRVRSGADVFLGDRFRIGLSVGYHFVSDFDEPIGRDKDYSGPEFAFGFGVLIGAGK